MAACVSAADARASALLSHVLVQPNTQAFALCATQGVSMEDVDWAHMHAAGLLVVPTTPELQQGRCPPLPKHQRGRNQHPKGATQPTSGGKMQ